jgi:hypothetical protein
MDKIIQFKQFNKEKIRRQYELESCDDELVELAEKLIQSNPAHAADKKKDALKAECLRRAAEYRAVIRQLQDPSEGGELSDDELDAAAGGLLHPEDFEDPFNDK